MLLNLTGASLFGRCLTPDIDLEFSVGSVWVGDFEPHWAVQYGNGGVPGTARRVKWPLSC